MSPFEKTYSTEEAAQILGLCIDSVRRHFRSGKLPGVRVGRNWRIAQSQLETYMGVEHSPSDALPVQSTPKPKTGRGHKSEEGVVITLLRTVAVRDQINQIVRQAAATTQVPPSATQRLLSELNILLQEQ